MSLTISFDITGCQDIDDAMGVRWVYGQPGVLEIAVCIADVCAFLPQGCALDIEAQARGTTVYLTHTRMDMLPSLISSMFSCCSLYIFQNSIICVSATSV
jgi:ribonuclease R